MKSKSPFILRKSLFKVLGLFLAITTMFSCEDEIADIGSIEDLTPPEANFSFSQETPSEYLKITFSNASISATDYLWDFGDGNSSIALEPTHTYAADGTYLVKLTASDKLGKVSKFELEVVLAAPTSFIPPIKEFGFEDNQLDGGTGDGRDSWRNPDFGGVIQITSSPVQQGSQAAKLTGDPSDKRVGYQLLTVDDSTVYDLSFYYTMKDDQAGFLSVMIIDGTVTSHADALANKIAARTVSNQSSPGTYVEETLSFYTADKTEVAIYFFNEGTVETRLDNFSIDLGTGAVAPLADFTFEEDTSGYNVINFSNNSNNADSYIWDFGDGTISSAVSPQHTFPADGTYSVTLTAENASGGKNSVTKSVLIGAPLPMASFTFEVDPSDYKKISFTNTSVDATSYSWEFGDGNSSSNTSPTHTYAADGTYTVRLTATNSSNDQNAVSVDVEISAPPTVFITNPSFDDEAARNDNRVAWRNQALETDADNFFGASDYVLQTSNSPRTGSWAGKLPTEENAAGKSRRWLYQAIKVEQNKNYSIKGWIRNKASAVGSTVTFEIYDAPFNTASTIGDATKIIKSATFDASTGHDVNAYTEAEITFNSGSSTEVVLFISNDNTITTVDSETFLDDFSIEGQ